MTDITPTPVPVQPVYVVQHPPATRKGLALQSRLGKNAYCHELAAKLCPKLWALTRVARTAGRRFRTLG